MRPTPRPRHTRVARRRSAGFTLTELLIVAVILAIIAALAIPRGSDGATRLRSAAERLVADLDYAQAASIGRGDDPCVVAFDLDAQTYRVARASDPATPIERPTRTDWVVRLGDAGERGLAGVRITGVSLGGDGVLAFASHGALQESSDASVVLGFGSDSLTVTVDAETGVASVE